MFYEHTLYSLWPPLETGVLLLLLLWLYSSRIRNDEVSCSCKSPHCVLHSWSSHNEILSRFWRFILIIIVIVDEKLDVIGWKSSTIIWSQSDQTIKKSLETWNTWIEDSSQSLEDSFSWNIIIKVIEGKHNIVKSSLVLLHSIETKEMPCSMGTLPWH